MSHPKINYRDRARKHVKAAKEALATTGEDTAQYACLKLRMAIEALTYQVLQAYLAEVPTEAMKQWSPKKVLDEMLEVDPNADQSSTVRIGKQDAPGGPATEMRFLGEDKRFTVKWGNKAHNALGNFLHEPTIAQMERGGDALEDAARRKAAEVLKVLEDILDVPFMQFNMGNYVAITCECGVAVKRKKGALEAGKPFSCGSCRMRYTYELSDDGENYKLRPEQLSYVCESCEVESWVYAHQIETQPVVVCQCGAKVQIRLGYFLEPVEPVPGDSP